MEDEEIKKPIIIDNGTGYIKAGFEGETEPKNCYSKSNRTS